MMYWFYVSQDEQLVDKAVLALLRICDAFSGKPSLLEKLSETQLITTTFDMVSGSAIMQFTSGLKPVGNRLFTRSSCYVNLKKQQ